MDEYARAIEATIFASEAPLTVDEIVENVGEGPVEIALTGTWNGKVIGLSGTAQLGPDKRSIGANHAKLAVSTGSGSPLVIFDRSR